MEEKNQEEASKEDFDFSLVWYPNLAKSHAIEEACHDGNEVGPLYILTPNAFDFCQEPVTIDMHSTNVCLISNLNTLAKVVVNIISVISQRNQNLSLVLFSFMSVAIGLKLVVH